MRSANARFARHHSKSFLADHFLACAWIVVWLCGAGSGQVVHPALPSENQTNVIHGTVVNAVTQEPIGRALVRSTDNRYAALTDGKGHFEFTLPESAMAGNFLTLMAQRPGFIDDPNGPAQLMASPGSALRIPLIPEALIKGRVTIAASEPARGINLELLIRRVQDGMPRWMPQASVITNSNGEFRFAELPAGAYKLLTHEWMDNDPLSNLPGTQTFGFPPVYYPNGSDFSAAVPIPINAGQTLQADMSLVRQPYYPVRVPVVNAGENRGFNITVSPQGQHGPGYALGFNQANHAIEGSLPAGKYLVEAASFGPISTSGSVHLTVGGGATEGPTMVLAPDNSIPVDVKEEFSNDASPRSGTWNNGRTFPNRGPRLDVYMNAEPVDDFVPRGAGSIRQPTGPEDESLVLQNLAPGRYWLRIGAARGYVASATMGGTDLLREPLVVVPGSSTPIDITLRDDSAKLDGTLANFAPKQGLPGLSSSVGFVECIPLPDSHGQFLEIPISPDGTFDVMNVTPGAYRVIAFSKPERDIPYRDLEAMKAYEAKGQVVNLAPGQKVTVQLQQISSR